MKAFTSFYRIILFICCIFSYTIQIANAQTEGNDRQVIQFSGLILDGTARELLPVPFATVAVNQQQRGTYADYNGFFSIVVQAGDIVEFSSIGYQTVEFRVPDTLRDSRYSIVQLMTRDTFNLPETVVFPWPSREHFKIEFLAMDVTSDLQKKALENLASENLSRARKELKYDGSESASFYLRQQSNAFYHFGQGPPMNIFSPIAWKQFFDAWKRGDFKKKN